MIKYILIITLLSFGKTIFCQSNNNPLFDSANFAFIEFDKKVLNLDTVKVNSITKSSFKFYNTGKIPLIIKDVKSSCGCTIVSFNKKHVKTKHIIMTSLFSLLIPTYNEAANIPALYKRLVKVLAGGME